MEFRSKFPPRWPLCLAELMVASSVGEHERLDLGLMGILGVLLDWGCYQWSGHRVHSTCCLTEFSLHSTDIVDLYVLFLRSVFSSVTYLVGYKGQAEEQSPGLNLQGSTCHLLVQVLMCPAHRSTSSALGSFCQCQVGKHCHPEETSPGPVLQQKTDRESLLPSNLRKPR